jgi:HAD superfamily hydrolase (TIGR01509 family)
VKNVKSGDERAVNRSEVRSLNSRTSCRILALDAMGVIYAEPNDGANLLYPFIVEKGGCPDVEEILRLYSAASLGRISSAEFWTGAGLDPALEDEYLKRLELSRGLSEFLDGMASRGVELWCLSNDVSEWSKKLRKKFALDRYFQGFVISGDMGTRKPDPAIYHRLLELAGCRACDVVFVDDRLRNIEAAAALGMGAILFKPEAEEMHGHKHPIAQNFQELLSVLQAKGFLSLRIADCGLRIDENPL